MTKEKQLKELEALRTEYNKATDFISRRYMINRMIDFLKVLENEKLRPEDLEPIRQRLKDIEKNTRIYDYSLAEQLREQKTIIADSIESSPYHLKRLELKNVAMIEFNEKMQK